jgi:hypothetical protein
MSSKTIIETEIEYEKLLELKEETAALIKSVSSFQESIKDSVDSLPEATVLKLLEMSKIQSQLCLFFIRNKKYLNY